MYQSGCYMCFDSLLLTSMGLPMQKNPEKKDISYFSLRVSGNGNRHYNGEAGHMHFDTLQHNELKRYSVSGHLGHCMCPISSRPGHEKYYTKSTIFQYPIISRQPQVTFNNDVFI